MEIGVTFPTVELKGDRDEMRAFVIAVGELGFAHLRIYDHVVFAGPKVNAGLVYDHEDSFHEPLVFLGYAAALADVGLFTSILILPQRQTALVAKQCAELDFLCGGRLRLGVGVGHIPVEFQTLGAPDFDRRGEVIEDQIEVLRAFWTQEFVEHESEFHHIPQATIRPMPIQRPIPIWMGGASPAPRMPMKVLDRIGRLADGWVPALMDPGPELDRRMDAIRAAAARAGRDPESIGLEGRVDIAHMTEDEIVENVEAWRAAGATHVGLRTVYTKPLKTGFTSVDQHIAAIERAAGALKSQLAPA